MEYILKAIVHHDKFKYNSVAFGKLINDEHEKASIIITVNDITRSSSTGLVLVKRYNLKLISSIKNVFFFWGGLFTPNTHL